MPRRGWSREETLVALNLYCRTPFGRLHARNPEIVEVAIALGRTPSALAMKCCNLAAFDETLQNRGISGLTKGSQLDAQIWHEFESDPESVSFESENTYARLLRREVRAEVAVEWQDVQGLDRTAVTRVRVNQHFFRSLILASYRARCAICELPLRPLLVASHIVPWSIDRSLRMNPHNGICLCTLHDAAYDKGLLSISGDYKISVAPEVQEHTSIPCIAANFVRFQGGNLILPDRWLPDPQLLARHLPPSVTGL